MPFQSGRYRVGATYDHSLTEGITKSGQSTLSSFLDESGIKAYDVIDRQVGIRCVTKTRRPIVEHPDIKIYMLCRVWIKRIYDMPILYGQIIRLDFIEVSLIKNDLFC